MTGTLYKLVGEKNRLDKTSYLTNATNITGVVIKFPSSIIEPILTLNGAAIANLWQFNYIRLDEFGRYYFIDDIISVANNLWEVHCHVDVLMSWKDEIKTNSCIATRRTNANASKLTDRINSPQNEGLVSMIYELELFNNSSDFAVICGIVNNQSKQNISANGTNPKDGNIFHQPPSQVQVPFKGGTVYLMSILDLTRICEQYGSDNNIMSNIRIAVAFPFDVEDFLLTFNIRDNLFISTPVYLGDTKVPVQIDIPDGDPLTRPEFRQDGRYFSPVKYIDLSDYLTNSYLDYEPYSEWYIHIPFYGDVNIPASDILSSGNILYYQIAIDILAGIIYFEFFKTSDAKSILSISAQVAVPINIGSSNADQIARDRNNIQIQANNQAALGAISMIGAALLAATGVGAPAAAGLAIGGIGSGISAISTFEKKKNIPNPSAQNVTNGVSNLSPYIDNRIKVYKKYYPPTMNIEDYSSIIGIACNDSLLISECTGYLEVGTCHLDNVPALSQELDEIMQLLQSGILM